MNPNFSKNLIPLFVLLLPASTVFPHGLDTLSSSDAKSSAFIPCAETENVRVETIAGAPVVSFLTGLHDMEAARAEESVFMDSDDDALAVIAPHAAPASLPQQIRKESNPVTAAGIAFCMPPPSRPQPVKFGRGNIFAAGEASHIFMASAMGVERSTMTFASCYPVYLLEWKMYSYDPVNYQSNYLFFAGLTGQLGLKAWEILSPSRGTKTNDTKILNSVFTFLSDNNIDLRISGGFANRYSVSLQVAF